MARLEYELTYYDSAVNRFKAREEYKASNNWVDKEIHWELCKKFKFDHTNKWYMYNPESVQENETHKLLWDFEIEIDHLMSARRLDLIIINKEREFVPGDHREQLKESEMKDKYQKLTCELKKLSNMKVTVIPIVIGVLCTVTKGLVKGQVHLKIRRRVETIQNTVLLRSARILRIVLETLEDLSLKLQ